METEKDLGKKLIWLREREGLNQGEFARKVGLTQAAISQFEDGKRSPSISSLRKIGNALGLSLNELTEDPAPTHENENDAAIEVLVRAVKNSGLSKDAIVSLAKFVSASKPKSKRNILLDQAGALAGDETLDELHANIDAARKAPA